MNTITPNDTTAWHNLQKNIASCGHEIRFISACKTFLEDTCNICFEDYIDHPNRSICIVHPCGHTAHGECIKKWLKKNNTCTQCRGIGNRVIQFINLKTLISSLNTCNKDRCYNNKSPKGFNIVEMLAITPKQLVANPAEQERVLTVIAFLELAAGIGIGIGIAIGIVIVIAVTIAIDLIGIELLTMGIPLELVVLLIMIITYYK